MTKNMAVMLNATSTGTALRSWLANASSNVNTTSWSFKKS